MGVPETRLYSARHYTEVTHGAVRRQRDRLKQRPPQLADGYLFVIALADLVRAARVVQKLTKSKALADALCAFECAAPTAKNFRDLIEHWDDYVEGKGRRQRDLGLEKGRHWFWWKSHVSVLVLRIGATKGGLELDVKAASQASLDLYVATTKALREGC
jgi:hypothetical protein